MADWLSNIHPWRNSSRVDCTTSIPSPSCWVQCRDTIEILLHTTENDWNTNHFTHKISHITIYHHHLIFTYFIWKLELFGGGGYVWIYLFSLEQEYVQTPPPCTKLYCVLYITHYKTLAMRLVYCACAAADSVANWLSSSPLSDQHICF